MGILQGMNAEHLVLMFLDRGITEDMIDRAMKTLVGNDWRDTKASVWFNRLQNDGFIVHDNADIFIDDLEALVKGRITLDELYRRG
ncbi:MAG TPA: hypothetical protein VEM40_10515 [Nitrospirota bacterium]|nr:hypothetical protein [Nitrospirota bacterium]